MRGMTHAGGREIQVPRGKNRSCYTPVPGEPTLGTRRAPEAAGARARERERALKIDDEQRVRYRVAVEAVAEWVVARVHARDVPPDDFMETALQILRRFEATATSEHLWIFRDPIVLQASDDAFDALDQRGGGQRQWLHADLASAVAAVARYDVLSLVGEWVVTDELEDGDGSARASGS